MKKLGVGLFMLVIISIYIISMKNIGKDGSGTGSSKESDISQNTSTRLKELGNKIKKEYPDTPTEVVQMHNNFMSIAYSTEISEKDISIYVDGVRALYSEELKQLNSIEEQTKSIIDEMNINKKDSFIIISSKIDDVVMIKDSDKEEPKVAEAVVKHSTSQGDLIRTYRLIKENEQWKICSWENDKAETANLEE